MSLEVAKRKRGRDRSDRMETLADLTPENLKKSTAEDKRKSRTAGQVSPEEQADWDARVAEAKANRSSRRTLAPLVIAGVAVAAVVGVVVWSAVSSGGPVTVGSMPTPVIAADEAGSAVYPANSAEAVRENVRFGFAPAIDLVELGDGTVVLGAGGEEDGADVFSAPYGELSADEFSQASIPAPRDDTNAGTPATWAEVFADYGEDTIFLPAVDTRGELEAVLSTAAEAERQDAVIVRTSDEGLAQQATRAGAVALFDGDVESSTPDELAAAGYWGAAVPVDASGLEDWTGADLSIWVEGQVQANEVQELVDSGVDGLIVPDPFAVRGDEEA